MRKNICELMTTQLVKVEADRSVAEAAHCMREKNVGDVLVVRDGRLIGIVTDRDIVVRCVALDIDPDTTRVERVCSEKLWMLSPDDDLDDAVRLMQDNAIRRIPVVAHDEPLGIVSLGDLMLECDRHSTLGKISAAPPNC